MSWLGDAFRSASTGLGEAMYWGLTKTGEVTGMYSQDDLNQSMLEEGSYVDRLADQGERVLDSVETMEKGNLVEGGREFVGAQANGLTDATLTTAQTVGLTDMTDEQILEQAAANEQKLKFAYDTATVGPDEAMSNAFWETPFGEFLLDTWNNIKEFFTNLMDSPIETLTNAFTGIIEWFGELFEHAGNLFDKYVSEPATELYNDAKVTVGFAPT